jgi:RNA polymerase subunit RPABC4/transcription elongation factor Spt4
MAQIVKPKPECRHCRTVLEHPLSKCPNCGRRSWLNLLFSGFGQRY